MKQLESHQRVNALTEDVAAQPREIATRSFSMSDQLEFAEFSGDFNPMHISPLAARRTQMGAPVVHGMHQVLWGLENAGAFVPDGIHIVGVQVRFPQPLYLDERADLLLIARDESFLRLAIRANKIVTGKIVLKLGRAAWPSPARLSGEFESFGEPATCHELAFEEITGIAGDLPAYLRWADAERIFPKACKLIGTIRVNSIAALSRLVGMVCPGLHSIFSSIDVQLGRVEENRLRFSVLSTDARFSVVRQSVSGGGIEGEVTAFMRMPPRKQPGIAEFRRLVRHDEFAGSVALVIGASRGVGEVVAKTIGAGGGHVLATYCTGVEECEQVASEIWAAGGRCDVMQYDAQRSPAEQLAILPVVPSSVYYFATPRIFGRTEGLLEKARFYEFLETYVNRFYALCSYLRESGIESLTIFYPSSIAVDSRPESMTAYAMAKAAGEILCDSMTVHWPGFRVIARRLPRMATDQTATLVSVDSMPIMDTMLPIISEVEHSILRATTVSNA